MMDKMNWLGLAVVFLIVAVVAGIFGFGNIAGASFTIARWFAMVFVVLFIISLIAHTIKRA